MNKKPVVIALSVLVMLAALAGAQSAVRAEEGSGSRKEEKRMEKVQKEVQKFNKKSEKMLDKIMEIGSHDDGDGDDDHGGLRFKDEDRDPADVRNVATAVMIGSAGHTVITNATIGSIAADSFMVNAWGMAFKIHMMPGTNILNARRGTIDVALASFQVGDMVDVRGTIEPTTPGMVHAKIIRNRTAATRLLGDRTSFITRQIEELLKKIEELRRIAGGGSPSPSATASPSATPSPTVTPSPTATPSPTQTATPSPTPSSI